MPITEIISFVMHLKDFENDFNDLKALIADLETHKENKAAFAKCLNDIIATINDMGFQIPGITASQLTSIETSIASVFA
jgi:hypothetical protein